MTEVNLYSFAEELFYKALPKLVEGLYKNGHIIQVMCADITQLKTIDNLLWTYSSLSFLPHGSFNDDFKEDHPIILTLHCNDNVNNADTLIILDYSIVDEKFYNTLLGFKKVLLVKKENQLGPLENLDNIMLFKEWIKLGITIYEINRSSDGKWEKRQKL